MSDQHEHSPNNIKVAFWLNLIFALVEVAGGLWTNSLAILSDALHDFGDAISLGIALYLEGYSRKSEDLKFTYGYRRFSLLGALITTVILIAGLLFILSKAVPRLVNPEHSNAPGMALMAVIGIGINGLAAFRLSKEHSFNARMVALHLIEDVLGWVAVLVASIIMIFADIHILDPILSILISLYVLYNVLRNMRKTLILFLQGVPDEVKLEELKEKVENLSGVKSTHHMHAWSLEGESHVLTMHVMVDEKAAREQVMKLRRKIRELLKGRDLLHSTIEIEYGPDDCMLDGSPAHNSVQTGG